MLENEYKMNIKQEVSNKMYIERKRPFPRKFNIWYSDKQWRCAVAVEHCEGHHEVPGGEGGKVDELWSVTH